MICSLCSVFVRNTFAYSKQLLAWTYFWCRDKYVFEIVPWKYLRMLGHSLFPLHIPLFVNNLCRYCFDRVVIISFSNSFYTFIIGMFLCGNFTSRVISKLLLGMFFTLSNFWRKSAMPLTYEGIFLTVGWRWKSTYLEIVLVWQFAELNTGRPRFPVFKNFQPGAKFWRFKLVYSKSLSNVFCN